MAPRTLTSLVALVALVTVAVTVAAAHGDDFTATATATTERVLLASGATGDVVVLPPPLTPGPYFAQLDDFVDGTEMASAAVAGTRTAVLGGVPLNLTLRILSVPKPKPRPRRRGNRPAKATPIANAKVYVWHADARGAYSDANLLGVPGLNEDTRGQNWLRGVSTTTPDGLVRFNTIMPGWYSGRAVHLHVRVHLPSAASDLSFAVTTQLFVSDADVAAYKTVAPYTQDQQPFTPLASDFYFASVKDPKVRAGITLDVAPATTTSNNKGGLAASLNLGIRVASS